MSYQHKESFWRPAKKMHYLSLFFLPAIAAQRSGVIGVAMRP
jgi:hypothetical protein